MKAQNDSARTPFAASAQGAVGLRPTILGTSATRIPVGGRIRGGIMVLNRNVAGNKRAQEIYAAGVAAGRCFEDIAREICAAVQGITDPLRPKNVPYFTVRASDFPNGGVARMIMDKYGEDRGDGRRLYRFPVVFPADAWQAVMPHELIVWTNSGKQYWSEYSDDGEARYCKTYAPVLTDGRGRRALRTFGGRRVIDRPERGGVCDPERCPQYQDRQCNLAGRFIFYIPGIRSLGAFELPTRSFYAMQHAIERFKTIAFMRGGRISGFLDGKGATFFITKRRVELSRIGDDGRPTRVAQWLIELEAPIDVTALLRPEDESELLDVRKRADDAVEVLEGQPPQGPTGAHAPDSAREARVVEHVEATAFAPAARGTAASNGDASQGRQKDLSKRSGADGAVPIEGPLAGQGGKVEEEKATRAMTPALAADGDLAWIYDGCAALGVAGARFDQYAEKRWGRGWALAAAGRRRAIEEVNAFADDAESFRMKVNAELDVVG